MYKVGDKVEFIKYPNLRGKVVEVLPAADDLPETISVDMFIPADEPGFDYTGITENFWCGSEDLRANTGLQTDKGVCACKNAAAVSPLGGSLWICNACGKPLAPSQPKTTRPADGGKPAGDGATPEERKLL